MAMDFESTLDKYAELIVKVGINLQKGQKLVMNGKSFTRGVPLDAAPLVRRIAEHAYKAGAPFVDILWDDAQVALTRLNHSTKANIEEYPAWRTEGIYRTISDGGALFTLYAEDPDLFKDADPDLVSKAQRTMERNLAPVMDLLSLNAFNWSLTSVPVAGWAKKVFPEKDTQQAIDDLWQMIFTLCRLDRDDPVKAWEEHIAGLASRSDYLNNKAYDALHYRGPGTDLTIGMPKGHIWRSARVTSTKGIAYVANLPTEEVFSMPDKNRAEGTVKAALPLSYSGRLIEDFSVTFKGGRAVKVEAKKGQDTLQNLIESDEGAARLGEVALVPQSSPIAQTGILFYNTLFDENAASHIALGRAYQETIQGGEEMSPEEFEAAGGNKSIVHVDFMIGSKEMDIDGLTADGKAEPIMRQGEWAFDVE